MKPTEDVIGEKLAQLAEKIVGSAMADEVGLADRIDAFKVLTTYYVNTTKINARPDTDSEGGPDFGDFQQRIQAAASRGG